MADMAQTEDVEDAWVELSSILDITRVIPITYMNSTAAIKSICGKNNGIVCTSSNAVNTFEWALKRGDKILFLPDQHLGRNTGLKMGIKEEEMVVWNPFKRNGGLTENEIRSSKLIL